MSFDAASAIHSAGPDPSSAHVSLSCLDFLLIELVPMAQRLAEELAKREEEWMRGTSGVTAGSESKRRSGDTMVSTGMRTPRDSGSTAAAGGSSSGAAATAGSGTVGGAVSGTGIAADDDEVREAVFYRLEMLGYRVGLGIAERFSRDKPRFTDTLDVIKFLCKDLWSIVFRKQIDNLKTNHRGIFVLTDNNFKPLGRISVEKHHHGVLQESQPFLFFPTGIIRGCLAAMGIEASVQGETPGLPSASFQIRTAGAKP
ncbi:transport protein particle component [Lineolata rhizophorae]|uniref:Transport protein particle component n=1 Tax=Lineolata rhizophorae TaxID=578093 RepID=A0A6A6P036_9PEZI|nr:transport protein particle component [Lineolata rhizophorae]